MRCQMQRLFAVVQKDGCLWGTYADRPTAETWAADRGGDVVEFCQRKLFDDLKFQAKRLADDASKYLTAMHCDQFDPDSWFSIRVESAIAAVRRVLAGSELEDFKALGWTADFYTRDGVEFLMIDPQGRRMTVEEARAALKEGK